MQYRKDRNGNDLSILGYGCMRFTKKGGGIDIAKAEREVLAAWRAGVNYYDTAYIYPGSEAALGEIFERNQIRDQIHAFRVIIRRAAVGRQRIVVKRLLYTESIPSALI